MPKRKKPKHVFIKRTTFNVDIPNSICAITLNKTNDNNNQTKSEHQKGNVNMDCNDWIIVDNEISFTYTWWGPLKTYLLVTLNYPGFRVFTIKKWTCILHITKRMRAHMHTHILKVINILLQHILFVFNSFITCSNSYCFDISLYSLYFAPIVCPCKTSNQEQHLLSILYCYPILMFIEYIVLFPNVFLNTKCTHIGIFLPLS